MDDSKTQITSLLQQYSQGDRESLEPLLELVYSELKKIAQSYMRKEKNNHTLQPTALVHEAFFRLIDQDQMQWQNRSHFFAIASQQMRRILVDHARSKGAEKRGGSKANLSFDEQIHDKKAPTRTHVLDLVRLDHALKKLAEIDERQSKIVELRYFGGLSIEDTSQILEISPATIKREWVLAKAWLFREITSEAL